MPNRRLAVVSTIAFMFICGAMSTCRRNMNWNIISFHMGYWIRNGICEMAAILFRPHCVTLWLAINNRQIAVSSHFGCDVKYIDCHPPNDNIACNVHYLTNCEHQLTATSSTSCIIQYTHPCDLLVAKPTSLFQQSRFFSLMSCIFFFRQ